MIKLWTPRGYFVTPRCTLAGQIKRAFFLETRGASLGGRARHRRGLESSACSASDDAGCSGCPARAEEGLLACCRFRRRARRVDQKARPRRPDESAGHKVRTFIFLLSRPVVFLSDR
jgi:hypothetical protein